MVGRHLHASSGERDGFPPSRSPPVSVLFWSATSSHGCCHVVADVVKPS